MRRSRKPRRLLVLAQGALALSTLALSALGTAAQAQAFRVTLNTASLAGTAGSLDFQFNPAMSNTPNATLQITGFTTTGTLAGTAMDTGSATGTLPGTLTIINSGVYNDVFQGITFGSSLSFLAAFSGPALHPPPGTTSGSTFAFSVLDPTGSTTLLGTNLDGSALDIALNPNGILTPTSGSTALTVTALPVPEASSSVSFGVLLALGLGGMVIAAKRRKSGGKADALA